MTTAAYKAVLTSLTLQRRQLEGNLHALQQQINKKTVSIDNLAKFAAEYQTNQETHGIHHIATFLNAQHFIDKLAGVLYSEKQALNSLQDQHQQLKAQYGALNQKIEGLTDLLDNIHRTQLVERDKIEDIKRGELATLRAQRQQMENNR